MRWIDHAMDRVTRTYRKQFKGGIAPDEPFIVVGDIHGCINLLEDAIERIANAGDVLPLVFVGDYIDRGLNSMAVINRLFGLRHEWPKKVVCLMGNHEEMMLCFLHDPHRYHRLWLENGGRETLKSYSINPVSKTPTSEEILFTRDALKIAIGPQTLYWLHRLPTCWRNGNVWVTHAGADPNRPMDQQERATNTWGHQDFATRIRHDGQWVIHGHTIVKDVNISNGRVAVDVGSYKTGRLAVVRVSENSVQTIN